MWRGEREDLESANEGMSDESESNPSDAVAMRTSESETLLGLQKMIASLEGDKYKLEGGG